MGMMACMICGKRLNVYDEYATLLTHEDVAEEVPPVRELGGKYVCKDCWGELVRRSEKLGKEAGKVRSEMEEEIRIALINPKVKKVEDWNEIQKGSGFVFLDVNGCEISIFTDDLESFVKELLRKYENRERPWKRTQKLYVCKYCQKEFDNIHALAGHIRMSHPKRRRSRKLVEEVGEK